MPEIRENFYENILFKFESCSCDCVEDIEHITPGMEPKRTFKLQAHPEQKRIFGYAAKKGLVRISDNGSIEQSNILGELIALPGKDSKELARFMKDNGFIFPISSMGYQEIDELSLYNIIDRLRLTVELMTAANEGRRLFAAKDCSAAGRCRVTGFQRPFEQQKKTSQAFSRRPRGSTLNFLNLKSGET